MLQALLLLLMLSMQSFVLAHELDHGIGHNGNVCAACSINTGNDGAVVSDQFCPVVVPENSIVPVTLTAVTPSLVWLNSEPRGPPALH